MALFIEEEYPPLPFSTIKQVSKHFEPKSVELPLYPTVKIIEKPTQNSNIQLVAIVGLLGLFALFGLFAYLRSTK